MKKAQIKKIIILLLFNLCAFSQNKFNSKIDSLLTALQGHQLDTTKVRLYHKISYTYINDFNDSKRSKIYNDSVLLYSEKINYATGIGFYYYNSVFINESNSDYKKTILFAKKAKLIFEQNKEWEYYFKSADLLVRNLCKISENKEAKLIATKTINDAIKLKNSKYIGLFYKNLGLVTYLLGTSDKAINYYKKAISYAIKINDRDLESRIYFNISFIYSDLKKEEEALKYIDLALNYYTSQNDVLSMIKCLQEKALTYGKLENYEKQLKLNLYVKELIKKNNLEKSPVNIENSFFLGITYCLLKKYNLSNYYLKSIINEILYNKEWKSQVYRCFYDNYMGLNKTNEANFYLNKVLLDIDTLPDLDKVEVYKTKSEIESKLKNYESALKYHILYSDLKDKIELQNRKSEIHKLQVEFDVALKDNKISKLEIEKLKKDNDLKNRKIVIFFMTGFLILFSLLIYLLLKSNKKIKIKNNIIALSNTNLQQAQNETKKSLAEKDILLKEIHHRVKNNLQLIMSLLRVQGNKYDDIILDDFLDISESRISSMALIHEKLYQSDDLTQINFNEYVVKMTNDISNTFQSTEDKIQIDFDLIPVKFDVQTLIPLALIINELVINAFKHAFKNIKAGKIVIKLLQQEEKNILTISDNGAGITIDKDTKSIGLKLVKQLVFQLKAELEIKNFEGTQYQITFKTI